MGWGGKVFLRQLKSDEKAVLVFFALRIPKHCHRLVYLGFSEIRRRCPQESKMEMSQKECNT